jgi:DNA-directed RNA polymerase specialized sigma24 family protein
MDRVAEDNALVVRALAGDQGAFAMLKARAERAVRGYIVPRVGHVNEERKFIVDHALVDDLVQTTFTQVWRDLPKYDPNKYGFTPFAKNWATYMVKRYWATPVGRGVERPMTDVSDVGGSGGEDDETPGDRIDRLAHRGGVMEPPEDPVTPDVYDELLKLTFATASPPHQLIAFGFAKAADWKPRQIAAELSNVPLRQLETRLERSYVEQSDLPNERILPAFEPLRNRLDQRFDEAVREPTTLATYPGLHARIVGDTTFADYYTGEPTADVTQWWYAVKRRVLAEVQRRDSGPLVDLLRQAQRQSARRGAARRTAD